MVDDDDLERSLRRRWWQRLSPPALFGVVSLLVPLFAHFTINGVDYVRLGAGGLAVVSGLIAVVWALLAGRSGSKAVDSVFGVAIAGLGVSVALWSGMSPVGLLAVDRSDDARRLLAEDGFDEIEIVETSEDGAGVRFFGTRGGDFCQGTVRFDGPLSSSHSSSHTCGISEPLERVERRCAEGEVSACRAIPRRLRAEEPVDWSRATQAARRACTLGAAAECFEVGVAYETGDRGLPADPAQAFAMYTSACEGGNSVGCFNRGAMLTSGTGVDADPSAAAESYRTSCEMGYADGCHRLGNLYSDGEGVPRDPARARSLQDRACEGGSSAGCTNLAYAWLNGEGGERSEPEGYRLYRHACELDGDETACRVAARLLANGTGVDANPVAGVAQLREYCEGGESPASCAELGVLYVDGVEGIPPDPERARSLFDRACDGGADFGCRNAGVFRRDGLGGERDPEAARPFFERACELGMSRACDEARRL